MKLGLLTTQAIRFKVLVLLSALGILALLPSLAQAQTVPPHILLGTAQIDGAAVADGTRIIAWYGEDRLMSTTVRDGRYLLQVSQPEGSLPLTFTVAAFAAAETISWEMGGGTVLNLSASSDVALLVLALESLGDNLERVFYYDSDSESWIFYDPRPQFASTSSLTELIAGEVYWLDVATDQTVVLNGQERELIAGGNQIVW
ncbi:MAG: hypothetical protein ACE5Q6_19740 [Dehalococcoidia bacterium]